MPNVLVWKITVFPKRKHKLSFCDANVIFVRLRFHSAFWIFRFYFLSENHNSDDASDETYV